jgi:hypothetical protein
VLTDPYLPMLGDVFATPAWLSLSNVFNVGDVALWLGATWFIGRICRPGISNLAARTGEPS